MLTTSLVVTTYNWKSALSLVLRSIAWQAHLPNEVIIADDGSTAETQALIEASQSDFPVPLKHVWQEDMGFRAGTIRNKAMAQCQSDYIICIDGDMVLHPYFIADHIIAAKPGYFVQGSRVITSAERSQQLLKDPFNVLWDSLPKWNDDGISNRLNALRMPLLSKLAARLSRQNLNSIRSCNLATWKQDVIRVNGYNEEFVGWGREDSEFVVRLFNAGLKRKNLKFAGIAYHLYHNENSRESLPKNDDILNGSIRDKAVFCEKGINQHI